MILYRTEGGVQFTLTWSEHAPGCVQCRRVDQTRTATLAFTCVLGSKLLREDLEKRALLARTQAQKAVEKWADHAGVFKTRRGSPEVVRKTTRHVGDA